MSNAVKITDVPVYPVRHRRRNEVCEVPAGHGNRWLVGYRCRQGTGLGKRDTNPTSIC